MKALISGAGIGGLTAAYWLAKEGAQVTLVEKQTTFEPLGYSMIISGRCLAILDQMGATETLGRLRIPVTRSHILAPDGRPLSMVDFSSLNRPGGEGLFITRAALHETLTALIGDQPTLLMGTSVINFEQKPTGVVALLSDGSREEYDVLIGADGFHSHIRALLYGADEGIQRHDVVFLPFLSKNHDHLPMESYTLTDINRSVGVTVLSDELVSNLFWLRGVGLENARVPQPALMSLLRKNFASFGWRVPSILSRLGEFPIYADLVSQIRLPHWQEGRVTLIGDAAHALSPISAHGASAAIVGGYELASRLATSDDPVTALNDYESALRPGVIRLQDEALQTIDRFLPTSPFALTLQKFFLRWLPRATLQKMMMSQFTKDVFPPD